MNQAGEIPAAAWRPTERSKPVELGRGGKNCWSAETRLMATAVIDGIATRYEVVGSGPPLLMFSPGGFDATLDKWSTQSIYARIRPVDHLSQHYRCIIFDRRETGESGGRVERITWAHYLAQGKGLLDHLEIDRAHIMGACMGCCPAMALAVAYPEAAQSLVLYWPVGGPKEKRTKPLR